jgi:Protein of unknown function (DUF3662)/FHA domain
MRSMSRVERFFERLVERPSARLFRTRLQPIQVLRRIERAMQGGRGDGDHRNEAPDRFTIFVNPEDLASLTPLDEVAADLASDALSFARAHRLELRGKPRVAFHSDAAIRRGEVEVEARLSSASRSDAAHDLPSGTSVFEVPAVQAVSAVVDIREPNRPPRTVSVTARPLRIGRGSESDVTLRDARVSRQHARLHGRDGVLVLTDLGSTNGTRVNGQRIREVVLGAGDQIVMGDTVLVLRASPAGPTGSRGSSDADAAAF